MALSLSRNATCILSYNSAAPWDGAGRVPGECDTYEIGVLDGFSFTQATGTQNVTLNEAGATPKRGQAIFNTSIEPVDWSFTTYMRPRIDDLGTDLHGMTEKILWNALVSSAETNNTSTGGITSTAASCTVDVESSAKNQLLKLTGWFVFSDSSINYRLDNMCVNSASMDFDVDGIAQITWSGYASAVSHATPTNTPTTANDGSDGYAVAPSTADFILNRLSTVTLVSSISGSSKNYIFALTGGNVTIDNGISYVTPETLGVINSPIDHQTGTRAVSGNFTAYLDTATDSTKDMYVDMLTDVASADPDITNVFDIELKIGGTAAPNVIFRMQKAHLELPTLDTADVMGVTMNFTALEDGTFTGNDEITVQYTGLTVV